MEIRLIAWSVFLVVALHWQPAAADNLVRRSPFGVNVSSNTMEGVPELRVDFTVPTNCILYAERLHFQRADGSDCVPSKIVDPVVIIDPISGHEKRGYTHDFSVWLPSLDGSLTVKFQGCTNDACFFPEKRIFVAQPVGNYAETTPISEPKTETTNAPVDSADWKSLANNFHVVARQTGYLSPKELIAFLNEATHAPLVQTADPLAKLQNLGILAGGLLVLLGGLGLNLTPCVLPLIPINLAIIGAGRAAHSRRQGFLHGAAYGLGMALTYGTLGLAVVLTGTKFGTLNSLPWFNVIIAVIFIGLSLAMFDVFHIDFNRFDRFLGGRESMVARQAHSQTLVAFSLGIVAALLAGACVAPVVISVLLMASALHAQGSPIGLALPFLLGLGMALPWPFLGASLSFLPKPGKWMVWVKYSFGIVILLFALYYADLARGLFHQRHPQTSLASAPTSTSAASDANRTLIEALQKARVTGRSVFIDFAASWCKNCEAMDLTVFNQPTVRQKLQDFIVVKYRAESPGTAPAREVLDHFNVMGLPTYVVLANQ